MTGTMQHHTKYDGPRQGPGRSGGRKCSVCSLAGDGLAVVEAEFAKGNGVRRVYNAVGVPLGLSESALTRHRRFHMGSFALEVGVDSDLTVLDTLGDQARLHRNGMAMADAAYARGDSLAFDRASRVVSRSDETAARILGVEEHDWEQTVRLVVGWQSIAAHGIKKDPDWGEKFAGFIDALNLGGADEIRARVAAARINIEKENHHD